MKIFSQLTVATASKQAELHSIEVQIGLTWYPLRDVLPLFNKALITYDSTSGANYIYNLWLDYPGTIQAVRYTSAGVANTAASRDVIDASSVEVYDISKSTQTVPEFDAGINYLIPFTADAVTEVFPPMAENLLLDISTAFDALYLPTTWLYRSPSKMQVRNGSSFTCYTVKLNPANLNAVVEMKTTRRNVEDAQYTAAVLGQVGVVSRKGAY